MPLSRATKARILRRLNPMALLYGTMGMAAVVLVLHVIQVIGLLLGKSFGLNWVGSLFLLALPVHGFRWWALRQGWSAVSTHEATVPHLAKQLGLLTAADTTQDTPFGTVSEGLNHRTASLQHAVARKADALGWLTWRDVLDAANEAGIGAQHVQEPSFLGGTGPIARPSHWRRNLLPQAWASVDLDNALPQVDVLVAARPRL